MTAVSRRFPVPCSCRALGCAGGTHTGVTSAGGTVDKKPPGCCPHNVTRIPVTLSCFYSPKSLFLWQRGCGEPGGRDRQGWHWETWGHWGTWAHTVARGCRDMARHWGIWGHGVMEMLGVAWGTQGCWRTTGYGGASNGTGTWRWAGTGRHGDRRLCSSGGTCGPRTGAGRGLHNPPGDMGDCRVSSGRGHRGSSCGGQGCPLSPRAG